MYIVIPKTNYQIFTTNEEELYLCLNAFGIFVIRLKKYYITETLNNNTN